MNRSVIALAALVACSGAWASDVTYKCVVEHSLGIKMSEMRPARFKADYEYRIETVESYLKKTDGGDPYGYDIKEDKEYKYAVRRTDRDPSDYNNWEVLEDVGWEATADFDAYLSHYGKDASTTYEFKPDEGRMAVTNAGGASLWTIRHEETQDVYIDFTTCVAHYD